MLLVGMPAQWFDLDARQRTSKVKCLANLKQMSTALGMYVSDYDDRYPPANAWRDGLRLYTKTDACFVCPARPALSQGYAFNAALGGAAAKIVLRAAEVAYALRFQPERA